MAVVSGSIKVKKKDFEEVEFKYQEQQLSKGGAGSRGIQIGVSGSKRGVQKYKFDPNPHDNPKYNKGQEKFYKEVAQALVDLWITAQEAEAKRAKSKEVEGKFPRYGKAKVKVMEITYKLVST